MTNRVPAARTNKHHTRLLRECLRKHTQIGSTWDSPGERRFVTDDWTLQHYLGMYDRGQLKLAGGADLVDEIAALSRAVAEDNGLPSTMKIVLQDICRDATKYARKRYENEKRY